MSEFPSSGEPSMLQAGRRLRRGGQRNHTIPNIRSKARAPEPSPTARFLWRTADETRLVLGSGEGLGDEEMVEDDEVLGDGTLGGSAPDNEESPEDEGLDDDEVME